MAPFDALTLQAMLLDSASNLDREIADGVEGVHKRAYWRLYASNIDREIADGVEGVYKRAYWRLYNAIIEAIEDACKED
jgi:hypothetical protein